jgi:hypothetical protein
VPAARPSLYQSVEAAVSPAGSVRCVLVRSTAVRAYTAVPVRAQALARRSRILQASTAVVRTYVRPVLTAVVTVRRTTAVVGSYV